MLILMALYDERMGMNVWACILPSINWVLIIVWGEKGESKACVCVCECACVWVSEHLKLCQKPCGG